MGHFKQREAIKVEAELKHWFILMHTNHVEGYVKWSSDPALVEGAKHILLHAKLTAYPRSQQFGEEHFIAETNGKCYLLRRSEHVTK